MRKKEVEQMRKFVTERVEESGRYDILSVDECKLVISRKHLAEDSGRLYFFLHAGKMKLKDFNQELNSLSSMEIKVSNIFYKNDKDFMVRLGARGNLKGDHRSLKNYSDEEVNRMVHLRGLEKAVLDKQTSPNLIYYQPTTTRLEEAIRGYDMKTVILDYSHILQPFREDYHNEEAYNSAVMRYKNAVDRPSIDYKIAEEIFTTKNAINFKPIGRFFLQPAERFI